MSLAAEILGRLARDPEHPALEVEGRVHPRRELARLALRVAASLREAGVGPGERVAIGLPKSAWLAAAHLGTLAAGAVAWPLNPESPDAALRGLLARVEPAAGIAAPALAARALPLWPAARWLCPEPEAPAGATRLHAEGPLAERAVARRPGDPALLVFTSGTTSTPKGVALSHGNLTNNLAALAAAWDWSDADRLLHVLPVFHLHGLGIALYGGLLAGSTLVCQERFDAERVLREAAPSRISLLMAVPTMLHRLVEEGGPGDALAGLRLVISGSAALSPALRDRFRARFGHVVLERYGMSETGMITSQPLAGPRRPGSVGFPLPGVEVALRDPETGLDAGNGPGEVQVRGPGVFAGYWRDASADAAAFRAGWFRTGDLGRFEPDGQLVLVGRAKELVVTGGFKVAPRAVEEALEAEGDARVVELAVIGVPDEDLGERVVACVVLAAGVESAWDALVLDLRARAEARLPRHARPREYRRVRALPRNALGKLERARLAHAQLTGD